MNDTKVTQHTPCMCTDCRTTRALTTERQLEPTSEQQTIAELLEALEAAADALLPSANNTTRARAYAAVCQAARKARGG